MIESLLKVGFRRGHFLRASTGAMVITSILTALYALVDIA